MVASSASAGPRMVNMYSQVAKMTSFLSGPSPSRSLSPDAKAINRGLQPCHLILGVVMIGVIVLGAWVKIVGSCCGISAWECCIVPRL
jgi:hypothetical protein